MESSARVKHMEGQKSPSPHKCLSVFFLFWFFIEVALIQHSWPFKSAQSGGMSCVHHVVQPAPCSSCKTFSSLQKDISYPLCNHTHSPFPQPLVAMNLLSDNVDLPILDISYRRNHIIHDLSLRINSQDNLIVNIYKSHYQKLAT